MTFDNVIVKICVQFSGYNPEPGKTGPHSKPSESGFEWERRGSEMSELLTERESGTAGARDMELASTKLVLIGLRVHLFPSRTQKLSSGASTIVCG